MPRKNRSNAPGYMLHIIGRGVHGDLLCLNHESSRLLWNAIGTRALEFDVQILALV